MDSKSRLPMRRLHFVPHTHWDREWYLPFQEFRLKLVHLIDRLLSILQTQPEFSAFTLDGQAIVLEDYLELRPERFSELQELVQAARLVIGPWYVLPDEFLVSPEALIRNLLLGREVCSRFGTPMQVGYLPDPFGHIAQMPQILQGFGIQYAAFRRGLGDDPLELHWQAPDGSQVLVSYLRDGYDNAARAPVDPQAFQAFVLRLRDSLTPYSRCSELLLLNGTDHHEAQPEIPSLVENFDSSTDQLIISTLETYFEALGAEISEDKIVLPVIKGDLRDSRRHHLLPGVLSSRTWIKQRNHECETLLERWAEPFSALAEILLGDPMPTSIWTGHLATPRLTNAAEVLKSAWRLLLTCHPHDSICGCSVDQVHHEMRTRFDQVEQIANEITRQSLQGLAEGIDTESLSHSGARAALIVFNPHDHTHSDWARAALELPAGLDPFQLLDDQGNSLDYRIVHRSGRSLTDMELDAEGLKAMLAFVQGGEVMGLSVQDVAILEDPAQITVEVTLAEEIPPNLAAVEHGLKQIDSLLETNSDTSVRLIARFATQLEIEFLAEEVPGLGYKTYLLAPTRKKHEAEEWLDGNSIENQTLRVNVEPDGTLSIAIKANEERYEGLLQFSDIGERGDSYTHSPVGSANQLLTPVQKPFPRCRPLPGGAELEYQMVFEIPAGLETNQSARVASLVEMPVEVRLRLLAGVPRLDIELSVHNDARDHRLQVYFPSGIASETARYGAAFHATEGPTALPPFTAEWIEDPVIEKPMRDYVMVERGGRGFALASRGLREASVSPEGVIALTLLRCFGWLSRDDLPNRKGGAGPQIETPQAQELGVHTHAMSLIPVMGNATTAICQARAFQSGMRGLGTGLHPGRLSTSSSFIQSESPHFVLSACKSTTDGRLLVRGVNLTAETTFIRLILGFDVLRAYDAKLDETELGELQLEGRRSVQFPCRGYEIKTLLFQPKTA